MTMRANEVHEVLDLLGGLGSDPRVLGGWGVDALRERETRSHRDLDLAVVADLVGEAVRALVEIGFAVTTDWLPVRVELADAEERVVDLHPLHFADDGSAWQAGLEGTRYDYPADEWAVGLVGGRPVRCVSVAWQRQAHAGYPPRPVDVHDLAVLDELEGGS